MCSTIAKENKFHLEEIITEANSESDGTGDIIREILGGRP